MNKVTVTLVKPDKKKAVRKITTTHSHLGCGKCKKEK